MRDRGVKVGLVRLRTIRPYPDRSRLAMLLSQLQEVVGVIETNIGLGSVSSGGVVCMQEVAQRLV